MSAPCCIFLPLHGDSYFNQKVAWQVWNKSSAIGLDFLGSEILRYMIWSVLHSINVHKCSNLSMKSPLAWGVQKIHWGQPSPFDFLCEFMHSILFFFTAILRQNKWGPAFFSSPASASFAQVTSFICGHLQICLASHFVLFIAFLELLQMTNLF